MIAELLSIGTELLMGQIVNTNAQFISSELAPLGINVYHQVTVGDNPARLLDAVRTALGRADVAILTGGLGPTADDITKKAVAEAFGLSIIRYPEAEETLKERFKAMRREMTPNNLCQADFPEGSRLLKNPNGTAQGCVVECGGKAAIMLPGPPRELIPMFRNEVIPYLLEKSDHMLYSRELRIFGMGESSVEHTLRDMMAAQDNPTIAPYAKTGEVTLRITARCQNEEEGAALAAPVIDEIIKRLGDVVYSTDGEPLAMVCTKLLKQNGLTLSVAESCTGGLLASTLVDIPGSSAHFIEGAVTYADSAKIRRLNVSPTVINQHGAVSEACAREMALGMCKISGTDFALACTGIAGPGGGSAEKPVGLVFVALSDGKRTEVLQLNLTGNRARIREITVLHALDLLRRRLMAE